MSFPAQRCPGSRGRPRSRCSEHAGCGLDRAQREWSRLVKQPRRMAAHFEDFALRLGCQFRRQRRCTSHLLRRSACPLCPFPPSTLSDPTPFGLDTLPSARAWSLTTCVHSPVPTTSTSAPCTTLAWMNTTSPEGALPKPLSLVDKPLVDSQLHDFGVVREGVLEAGFALLVLYLGALSFQPSSLSSLLSATSVLTSSFLSRCTRNSTIRRISCSSLAHSWSIVAWRCGQLAPMFGSTWTDSCPGPCMSVSSTSCLHSPLWTRLPPISCSSCSSSP